MKRIPPPGTTRISVEVPNKTALQAMEIMRLTGTKDLSRAIVLAVEVCLKVARQVDREIRSGGAR